MKKLGMLADRLLAVVVPATTAGACACFGERADICQGGRLNSCQLNCKCAPHNCRWTGRYC